MTDIGALAHLLPNIVWNNRFMCFPVGHALSGAEGTSKTASAADITNPFETKFACAAITPRSLIPPVEEMSQLAVAEPVGMGSRTSSAPFPGSPGSHTSRGGAHVALAVRQET